MALRKPKIKNKYKLTVKDIEKFIVIDVEKLKTRCWRNNVINAWCYSKGFGKGYLANHMSSIWIGFYDKPYYGKYVRVSCDCMEDMCSYNFNKFFDYREIENEYDLLSQEAILEFANWLLDEKVCKRGK